MILKLAAWAGGYGDSPGLAPGSRVRAFLLVRGLGAVAWGLGACGGCTGALWCGLRLAGRWQGADGGEDGGQQVRAGGPPPDQLATHADQPRGGRRPGPPPGRTAPL